MIIKLVGKQKNTGLILILRKNASSELNEPASTILNYNVNPNTTDIPKINSNEKIYIYNSSSPPVFSLHDSFGSS